MAWTLLVAIALAPVAAAALVLTPRPLFAEVRGAPTHYGREFRAIGLLALVGVAALFMNHAETPLERALLALSIMILGAIIYVDARWLVIPDVYSIALAVLGLTDPNGPGLLASMEGAAVCGALFFIVYRAFRGSSEAGGMGFGDVKLAAAIGALFGPLHAMWVIAGSAIVSVIMALSIKRVRPASEGPLMFPYGAAMAGGAILALLVWR